MNNERNSKIEDILNSLDGSQKIKAPDFFYTRLKARMERELLPAAAKRPWILRPAYAIGILLLVLGINAAILLRGTDNTETTTDDSMQTIASEYSLNDNTILYDLASEK